MAVESFDKRVLRLIRDYYSSMPPCTSIYKVKDGQGVNEHYVTFHLVVKSVRNID